MKWWIYTVIPEGGAGNVLATLAAWCGRSQAQRIGQAIASSLGLRIVLVHARSRREADKALDVAPIQGRAVFANPTLVAHGLAKAARWHVLRAHSRTPLADLYTMGQDAAAKIATEIATVTGSPVELLSNESTPGTLAKHTRVRSRAGELTHAPRRSNPAAPAFGQVWARRGGGRVRILAVEGNRVKVLDLDSGNRDTLELAELAARYRAPERKANPSRSKRARARRAATRGKSRGIPRRAFRAMSKAAATAVPSLQYRHYLAGSAVRHQARAKGWGRISNPSPWPMYTCACGDYQTPPGIWSVGNGYDGFHSPSKCWIPELAEGGGVAGRLYDHAHKGTPTRTVPAWTSKLAGDLDSVPNPRGPRIVYNRLLGGWYIVTGPHQAPLGGAFASKAEAQAWLAGSDARRPRVSYVRTGPQANPGRQVAACNRRKHNPGCPCDGRCCASRGPVCECRCRGRNHGMSGGGVRPLFNPSPGGPICYGQTRGRGWVQEWYETATKDAGARARQLRAAGLRVGVEAMGSQVTPVGRVNMTMVTVGGTDDALDAMPPVRVVHQNPTRRNTNPYGRLEFIEGAGIALRDAADEFARRHWAHPRRIRDWKIDRDGQEATFTMVSGAGGKYRARFYLERDGRRGVAIEKDMPEANPRGRRGNPTWMVKGTIRRLGSKRKRSVSGPAAPLELVRAPRAPRTPRARRGARVRVIEPGTMVTVPYTGRASYFGRPVTRTREKAIMQGTVARDGETLAHVRVYRGKGAEDVYFPLAQVRKAPRPRKGTETARHPRLAAAVAREAGGDLAHAHDLLAAALEAEDQLYRAAGELYPQGDAPPSAQFRRAAAQHTRAKTRVKLLEALVAELTRAQYGADYDPFALEATGTGNPRRRRNPASERERAERTFEMWHEYGASKIKRVKVPNVQMPKHVVELGQVLRIDYLSPKWKGKPVAYTHTTKRPYPLLVSDPDARQLYLVGGKMKPTADGLVN